MSELPSEEEYQLVAGSDSFARQLATMVREARLNLAILTTNFDRRIYGTNDLLQALRRFTLQHRHASLRILVKSVQQAATGGSRLLEFGRALSSFVEFRELPEERREIEEEYIVADGRRLLHRGGPRERNARYYETAPYVARLKLRDFDALWNESEPAQELRNLRL